MSVMLRGLSRLSRRRCLASLSVAASNNVDVGVTQNVFLVRCQSTSASASQPSLSSASQQPQYVTPAELRKAWQKRRQPMFEVAKMKDLVKQ